MTVAASTRMAGWLPALVLCVGCAARTASGPVDRGLAQLGRCDTAAARQELTRALAAETDPSHEAAVAALVTKVDVVEGLRQYAGLLREARRDADAAAIEEGARKICQAAGETPTSAALGFDPTEQLRVYAAVLRERSREVEARETEAVAGAYEYDNVAHFLRGLTPPGRPAKGVVGATPGESWYLVLTTRASVRPDEELWKVYLSGVRDAPGPEQQVFALFLLEVDCRPGRYRPVRRTDYDASGRVMAESRSDAGFREAKPGSVVERVVQGGCKRQ